MSMGMEKKDKNSIFLRGYLGPVTFSHMVKSTKIMKSYIKINPIEGYEYRIPIIFKSSFDVGYGDFVNISGEVRTHDFTDKNGILHTNTSVFVYSMNPAIKDDICLNGGEISGIVEHTYRVRGNEGIYAQFSSDRGYSKNNITIRATGKQEKELLSIPHGVRIVLKGYLDAHKYMKNGNIRNAYEFIVSDIKQY